MHPATPPGLDRRRFLNRLAIGVPAAAFMPLTWQRLLAGTTDEDRAGRIITAVEIVRVSGPAETVAGRNRQYNLTPAHLYDDTRPAPYRDAADPKASSTTKTHHYVRIRTKSGVEGFYGYVDPEAVTPILNQLGKVLVGKDALAVEKLWDQMYRSNRHARASHYMMAISMLDCALWDWRGKYYKAPVYELLGGPTRNPVKVYGSCLGFSVESPEVVGKRVAQLRAQGFDFQKWFFATGPGSGPKGLHAAIDLARAARENIGEDGEVMFDAYQGWDLQFARQWCEAAEQYRPYWIEECFPVADLESFIQLARFTRIPIATGEHFYNRWEVMQYLKSGAATIIQADPEWCGGVSELVKICTLATGFGAKVIPHGHNIHAALHVVASQSPSVCPMAEYLINHMPDKVHFQKNPLLTDNGWLKLPTAPGFGLALDDAKIEKTDILTASA
jgi:L-alanine-DL-glutamate epimerase-like enolase superfamily enzyme